MWSAGVVVFLPSLQFFARVVHRNELVNVQELIAQTTVERLDQPVIRGLAGPGVVELDTASPGPLARVNRPGFELTPRSWAVTIPPIRRCFSAGSPPG